MGSSAKLPVLTVCAVPAMLVMQARAAPLQDTRQLQDMFSCDSSAICLSDYQCKAGNCSHAVLKQGVRQVVHQKKSSMLMWGSSIICLAKFQCQASSVGGAGACSAGAPAGWEGGGRGAGGGDAHVEGAAEVGAAVAHTLPAHLHAQRCPHSGPALQPHCHGQSVFLAALFSAVLVTCRCECIVPPDSNLCYNLIVSQLSGSLFLCMYDAACILALQFHCHCHGQYVV